MKTISILNIKGGVAKSISSINIAYTLAALHGYRVLLIDNDKQGNTSKFFHRHDESRDSLADLLTERNYETLRAIRSTAYERLDIIPANMNLLYADKQILMDVSRPQQTRLKKALAAIADNYDFCIIDNAPDLSMSVMNGLVACDEVLIPIKIDSFATDGIKQVKEAVEDMREFNAHIHIAGCFVTMYQKNSVNTQGAETLEEVVGLPVYKTVIRKTVRVDETTYTGAPLLEYAPRSTAAQDYVALVAEYLARGCANN